MLITSRIWIRGVARPRAATATVDSKNTSEFAIAVLLNHNNRALPIYEGKDNHVKFEDRVEHFLNILEQLFDYQVHAAGPDGSGYSSKGIPRAHFEDWDFHDLATELDSLHPRLATFAAKGKAWVDFTRSVHAINLLGRDFGEILAPSDVSCPHWASLPKDQYYLAAGISDLKMVLEYTGDLTTNPIRLNQNLVWHNSDLDFESCGCVHATADHADVVQVILPASLSAYSEGCIDAVKLSHDGAVVFGYNRNFQWPWGDSGDPERDELTSDVQDQLTPTVDPENTNSNTLLVGSESDVLDVSSSQIRSMSTDITVASTAVGNETVHPRPLVQIIHQVAIRVTQGRRLRCRHCMRAAVRAPGCSRFIRPNSPRSPPVCRRFEPLCPGGYRAAQGCRCLSPRWRVWHKLCRGCCIQFAKKLSLGKVLPLGRHRWWFSIVQERYSPWRCRGQQADRHESRCDSVRHGQGP